MGQNCGIVPTCSFGKSKHKDISYQYLVARVSIEENFTVNTDGCCYVVPVMCHPSWLGSIQPRTKTISILQFMTVLAHLQDL